MHREKWQKELAACIRSFDELEGFAALPDRPALEQAVGKMRLAITPHTLKLIDFGDPRDPLLLMAVPRKEELRACPGELSDPIGDMAKSPVPFLVHRYPDRVLVLTTFFCAQSCRFCFRRAKTGQGGPGPAPADVARILKYVRSHPGIEETILSGGDPLTLTDDRLERWILDLKNIPTIKRLRIHTRAPVNLPSRITPKLVRLLKRFQTPTFPINIVTHFNHPKEIAADNIRAIARLADAGFVVRNQSVLLKSVNDDPETLETLFKKLVDIRVVPNYLHQLDLAPGTGHFRVPLKRGIEIMRQLQGKTTGIALPRYMLDLPGGHGKIPLGHAYLTADRNGSWTAESPSGKILPYAEP